MWGKPMVKTTVDETGTITYNEIKGKKTSVVVKQDVYDQKRGNPEGTWYVFKITPRNVRTEFEGQKGECIWYAENLVKLMGSKNGGNVK